jgi:hypothetical protein
MSFFFLHRKNEMNCMIDQLMLSDFSSNNWL